MSKHSKQRGYNLVEVLIAMALLSVVLLSIFTLFVMGRGNVYSGKQLTQANAVGRHVLEDLSTLTINDVRAAFNIADDDTLGDIDVDTTRELPGDEYTDAIMRTTETINADTDPRGFLEDWHDQMVNQEKLGNGEVILVFRPQEPFPVAATLAPDNATVMQIRVIVRWNEGPRRRQAIFDTSKVQRPS